MNRVDLHCKHNIERGGENALETTENCTFHRVASAVCSMVGMTLNNYRVEMNRIRTDYGPADDDDYYYY